MKKTFKIIGNGKGVRTIYNSFPEAKDIIVQNKIEPLITESQVFIEETTIKIHKIDVNVPTLSIENKKFLIDYVLEHLTEETIESRDNIINVLYIIKFPNNVHPILYELLKNWAIDTYDTSDSELKSVSLVEKIYETPLFKRMDNKSLNRIGYVNCIKKLLETVKPEEFHFSYNFTNLKACHNILIELPYIAKGRRTFDIQIRVNDFPYDEGVCYGRNTSVIKTFRLHDENFQMYCKSLNIIK